MTNNTNIAAEQALIGIILCDMAKNTRNIPKLANNIKPEYFSNPKLKEIYQIAVNLFAKGTPVDFVTILDAMAGDAGENKVLLVRCAESEFFISSLGEYVKILEKCYKARALQSLCSIQVDHQQIDKQLEQVALESNELIQSNKAHETVKLSEITAEQYMRLFDKESLKKRIFTGFPKVDKITKGFRNKNLIILAARPGVGKSALALILAYNFAKQGKKVAFYSLEMSKEEIYDRLMAHISGVNLSQIIDRDFENSKHGQMAKSADVMHKLPLYLNDSGTQTVQSIRIEAQIKKFDMVVIDYLQLLSVTEKTQNRNDEVGKMTRALKSMAMDLDIPVIALSQLNRSKEGNDEYKEPALTSLRDSGSIEQDANIVMMLWKDSRPAESKSSQYVNFKVAKNRSGFTGGFVFEFIGGAMRFIETDFEAMPYTANKKEVVPPWE